MELVAVDKVWLVVDDVVDSELVVEVVEVDPWSYEVVVDEV